jgi:hypothetical protein
MNNRIMLSSCMAATLAVTLVSAQGVNQTPTQSPVQGSTQGTGGQTRVGTGVESSTQVVVTGCVARESEQTTARGGVLGTGLGAGNEFVLANAMTGRTGATPNAQIAGGVSGSTSTGSGAVGTSGTASGGTATTTAARTGTGMSYSLTGNRESELALHVGKRVEIVGTVDANTTAAASGADASANARAGAAGGSAQAGASLEGRPTRAPRQLTIVSFRPVEGACQ